MTVSQAWHDYINVGNVARDPERSVTTQKNPDAATKNLVAKNRKKTPVSSPKKEFVMTPAKLVVVSDTKTELNIDPTLKTDQSEPAPPKITSMKCEASISLVKRPAEEKISGCLTPEIDKPKSVSVVSTVGKSETPSIEPKVVDKKEENVNKNINRAENDQVPVEDQSIYYQAFFRAHHPYAHVHTT